MVLSPVKLLKAQPIPVGSHLEENARLLDLMTPYRWGSSLEDGTKGVGEGAEAVDTPNAAAAFDSAQTFKEIRQQKRDSREFTRTPLSFASRPIWMSTYNELQFAYGASRSTHSSDSEEMPTAADPTGHPNWLTNATNLSKEVEFGNFFRIGSFPIEFRSIYSSGEPLNKNNAAAWYGKGFNSDVRAGFYLTSDYLTLTVRPQFVYSQNLDFEAPTAARYDNNGNETYLLTNFGIERIYRYGPDPYSTLDLGDSSLRLHFKAFEAGIGKENLWWGPGLESSLMLSNNAPGLESVFFGTRYPAKLPLRLGYLETRIIWARPESSPYWPQPKGNSRFLSGINLAYSPSALPGLSIGFNRMFHSYIGESGVSWSKRFEFIEGFLKKTLPGNEATDQINAGNQLASIFVRLALPNIHGEIYAEYIRDDHNWDGRDFVLSIQHMRGYSIGGRKLFPLAEGKMLSMNFEITSSSPDRLDEVRVQYPIYSNSAVIEGHTNEGALLSTWFGDGATVHQIKMSYFQQNIRLGLEFARVDTDYFTYSEGSDAQIPQLSKREGVQVDFSTPISVSRNRYTVQVRPGIKSNSFSVDSIFSSATSMLIQTSILYGF